MTPNDVSVQSRVTEVGKPLRERRDKAPPMLQDHCNATSRRNVWMRELR